MSGYFKDLEDAVVSTLKGMSVTLQHLFSKPVTVQYPDEKLPISEAFLGKHQLTQANCIACNLCVNACPVECIAFDSVRHPGKVIEFNFFSVDYNYCMFCGLCVEACNSDALHMTREYDLSAADRRDCKVNIISWTGLRPEDRETIEKAVKEKEEKARAAKEAKAKKEAPEKDGGGKKSDAPAPSKGGDEPPAAS